MANFLRFTPFHSLVALPTTMAESEVQHWHVTYNEIHNLIRASTPKIGSEFNPDLLVAIGQC